MNRHTLALAIRAWASIAVALPVGIAAPSYGAEESADEMIEEVVVTARKRTEDLQDVPVAVTALTSDQIAEFGIQDLSDVSKI
ncbi:MAG: hypothetical protein J4F45_07585, partial [Pseudomonadales bacterium]|nr:hypothetical protein [Pseudomonadales bacterium]